MLRNMLGAIILFKYIYNMGMGKLDVSKSRNSVRFAILPEFVSICCWQSYWILAINTVDGCEILHHLGWLNPYK